MLFRSLPKSEQRFLSQTCVLIFGQGSCNAGVSDTVCLRYIICCDTHYLGSLVSTVLLLRLFVLLMIKDYFYTTTYVTVIERLCGNSSVDCVLKLWSLGFASSVI